MQDAPKAQKLTADFTTKRNGAPLTVFQVNDSFKIGVYEGKKSQLDIIVKYRQKRPDGRWSRIRTPKHIHWVIDVLIKMDSEPELTRKFLDFLIGVWEKTEKFGSESDRNAALDLEALSQECVQEFSRFEKLGQHGEYSVKFLILIALLLMKQEQTNYENTQLFSMLFRKLRDGEDIFGHRFGRDLPRWLTNKRRT